jgi:hypothetical protein
LLRLGAEAALKVNSMNQISQVFEYRFLNPDISIVSLRAPVAEIAEKLGLSVEAWETDGLGRARGMFIRFSSGKVMLLRELEYAIEHLGQEGPTVYVDAGEVAAFGVESLVAEILGGLGLSSDKVAWMASSDVQRDATQMLNRMTHRNE